MDWWREILPVPGDEHGFAPVRRSVARSRRRRRARRRAPEKSMLLRPRLSRIYLSAPLLRLSDPLQHPDARATSGSCASSASGASYVATRLFPDPARDATSRISSSTASAGSSTARSSRTTPRRSGACRATGSAPNGARSGSRDCRSRGRSRTRFVRWLTRAHPRDVGQKGVETSLIEQFPVSEARARADVGGRSRDSVACDGRRACCSRRRASRAATRPASASPRSSAGHRRRRAPASSRATR